MMLQLWHYYSTGVVLLLTVYDPGSNIEEVVEHAQAKHTCLTAWFKANSDKALIIARAHDMLY